VLGVEIMSTSEDQNFGSGGGRKIKQSVVYMCAVGVTQHGETGRALSCRRPLWRGGGVGGTNKNFRERGKETEKSSFLKSEKAKSFWREW